MKKNKIRPDRLIIQELMMSTYRNRFWITVVVLATFILISVGIIFAVRSGTTLDNSWKEILLLMLGAFIGWAGRVIDFWFNNKERDEELLRRADEEDDFYFKNPDELEVGETSDKQILHG